MPSINVSANFFCLIRVNNFIDHYVNIQDDRITTVVNRTPTIQPKC